MLYAGSSHILNAQIIPILNNFIEKEKITTFYDLFCGGANIADSINCENIIAVDISPTLIALHKTAQTDFNKIPSSINRDLWAAARADYKQILQHFSYIRQNDYSKFTKMPLYEIGAYEWYGSFAHAGFYKGYANTTQRDCFSEARESHKIQASAATYKKIKFECNNYLFVKILPNSLVFCDIPQQDSLKYQINPHFDYTPFYKWALTQSKSNPIFIIEKSLPYSAKSILTLSPTKTLYLLDNRGSNTPLDFL